MRNRDVVGPILAVAVPFILFELLRAHPSWDVSLVALKGHFYVVSSVAMLSMMVAIAVGIAGHRVRNIKVSFLALAFISLGETFTVHGLSTPNLMIHASHLPAVAAQASTLLATFWLWLSSMSSDSALIVKLSGLRGRLIPIWLVLILILSIVSFMNPHLMSLIPLNQSPLQWLVTVLVAGMNLITIYRYYQSYRYSRFPLQKAIIYSCCWLMVAQYIMAAGELWRISWWMYHFLLLASMIVMITGLIRQYASNPSWNMTFRGLYSTDPMERITSCLSPSVRNLIQATEEKDLYTAGHNFRVTMYAMKLGEEMKLSPEELRAVSQGTIIHDVGKIHVPIEILNKPGRLTPEERDIIELHPVKGYEMCRTLGFMKDELDIIRSHHEKWDGTGYPDRLKGEQIPLLARIVAIADVYDALTSTRAYRKAWTHDEAMKLIIGDQGTHFDAECVQAWIRVCEQNPEIHEYPAHVVEKWGHRKMLLQAGEPEGAGGIC
ncbi:HD-GYP domain-containing protein [Paenibacillus sp. YPG26]|uniref:HD-GYP domain-containing protein n=1 Tax=Paenibacillus sp. YPG26 TaxID=2878915 RepID=UPI00203CF14B|nr:HD-GYP domain-containing protein [Paenibacillus sp. YPG26]USB33554.1 HD-GYP domain-containing protein [Paenibacillus sp. YPG26]